MISRRWLYLNMKQLGGMTSFIQFQLLYWKTRGNLHGLIQEEDDSVMQFPDKMNILFLFLQDSRHPIILFMSLLVIIINRFCRQRWHVSPTYTFPGYM